MNTRPIELRLWEKINKLSINECWPWMGSLTDKGYGRLTNNRRISLAHRLVFESVKGKIPSDIFVCHKCDNPRCCSPRHLFLGTAADNNSDRHTKGRNARQKGENNGMAKITEDEVFEIRRLAKTAKLSQTIIAERYGLTQSMVSRIKRGIAWRHI
jgi:predicted XRE-type DNA-binding protein